MTPGQAEELLTEWAAVAASRDARVLAALDAGLTKHRIHVLTGISRSTIDRIRANFEHSVLVTAELNANPRYRAALKDAEAASWDEPGVSVEEMIRAASQAARTARGPV